MLEVSLTQNEVEDLLQGDVPEQLQEMLLIEVVEKAFTQSAEVSY